MYKRTTEPSKRAKERVQKEYEGSSSVMFELSVQDLDTEERRKKIGAQISFEEKLREIF